MVKTMWFNHETFRFSALNNRTLGFFEAGGHHGMAILRKTMLSHQGIMCSGENGNTQMGSYGFFSNGMSIYVYWALGGPLSLSQENHAMELFIK